MAHQRSDRVVRVVATTLVLAGGVVHLRLALGDLGYPDRIERAFLLDVAASGVAAAALIAWPHRLAPYAALAVVNATMLAFGLSRTDRGVLGFQESGWNPSPEAALALACELGAAVALLAIVYLAGVERRS